MNKSEYIGNVYDGKWKVVDYRLSNSNPHYNYIYTLQNIFNKETIELGGSSLLKVKKGLTTISKILHSRINKKEHYKHGFYNFHKKKTN